ncbi:MAG: helix-turn-helix transcriptional regulator [Eubacteriales bacterium]
MKLKLTENLRKLRLEKGLTQEQLAEKMGVSYQAVSRWETGVTYPDIELLPSLAELFEVSLEKLMGVTRQERAEASTEYYKKLNATSDHAERLKLLHEIHREFPNDMTIVWNLCGETDDLDEQRKFTEVLLEHAEEDESIRVYADRAVEWLINTEDEEKLPPFLEKHTAPLQLSRELRLEERHQFRKEWDKYELLKQDNLRKGIFDIVFGRLVRKYPPTVDVHNSLWGSRTKLALIDLMTGTTGMRPVSGDGVPDLWFKARFDAGVRYSCQLASTGEPEHALAALEDLTELYEKFWSLPDQTVLTFRCPALDQMKGTLHHAMLRSPAAGPDYAEGITYNARILAYNTDENDPMWSHWMPNPLTLKHGWEWFDPIRNDERYRRCVERMEAFIIKGIRSPEE